MLRTAFKSLLLAMLGTLVGGCGVYQNVGDTSTSIARSLFYKQVKTLQLDFSGRAAINTDSQDMSALSVPTLVRVYQLRDGKAFGKVSYDSLLSDSSTILGTDLLDERAVLVRPGEGAQLSVPMDEAAQVVAVAALFRQPDRAKGTWRLVLTRDDLDPNRPRVVELADNHLTLHPLPKE